MAAKCPASLTHVECQKSTKALIFFGFGAPLLGASFLKKGPLKLQKGAHLTLIGQFLE